jgi:hypothetical protein
VLLARAAAGRGPLGCMPLQLGSILTGATQWPGGGAPDNRHDLFIGLSEPRKTEPAGVKRALHLPSLRGMAFATAHDHLLVPGGWERHGVCRIGAAHRESPRHNWDVAGCVGYLPRTLTGGSQLCKECNDPTLGDTGLRGMQYFCLHVARFQPLGNQLPCGKIANGLHQGGMSNIVERSIKLIPPSRTHDRTNPPRSK